MRRGLVALILLALQGCGDRDGSIDAAMKLAEANYPGQLELHDTHLQKDHYDVTLAVKGDPFTRIRFAIDADPARCRTGTRCEERLRRAYASAIPAGAKLKAANQAFGRCDVAPLGLHDSHVTVDFRVVVELDIDPGQPQPALDRLASCVSAFRAALPATADDRQRTILFAILRARPGERARAVRPLLFDSGPPDGPGDEVAYYASVPAGQDRIAASSLRLDPTYLSRATVRERLARAARQVLEAEPAGGHVPRLSFPRGAVLDPARIDRVTTHVPACSRPDPDTGRCRPDMAVRITYDLGTGSVSDPAVVRGLSDDQAWLDLLRPRGGAP